jgi:hypothetical protein
VGRSLAGAISSAPLAALARRLSTLGPRTTDLKVTVTDKDQQQNFKLKD